MGSRNSSELGNSSWNRLATLNLAAEVAADQVAAALRAALRAS